MAVAERMTTARTALPTWVAVVQVLLMAAWLLGTPMLVFSAVITSAPFFGEQPSAAEEAATRQTLVWAAVLACGAPFVACVLAARYRRSLAAAVFGSLAGLALVGTIALAAAEAGPGRPSPVPDQPRGCVELSGGPSDCP